MWKWKAGRECFYIDLIMRVAHDVKVPGPASQNGVLL